VLAVLVACSTGDYTSGPPPPPPSSTTVAEVTVRGEIGVFSPSARVIALAQPVGGFANIVVSLDTVVIRSNGATATVGDLVPRAGVEVTGRPGVPGTLVARRIVLL
jgi:hypothetical protein